MTEHLTEQQIESFHRRKMSPDGLRAAHQHLDVCEMCRAQLTPPGQVELALAAFEREFRQAEAEDDHLHYQQISGFVDNALDEIDREIVESHLAACAECAAEVQDLRNFKAAIATRESVPVKTHSQRERGLAWWNWWERSSPARQAAAAAVVILILAAAIFLLRIKSFRRDDTQLAQVRNAATRQKLLLGPSPLASPPVEQKGATENQPVNNREPLSPHRDKRLKRSGSESNPIPSSQIVVALKDGDGLLTLDARGRISGVAADTPAMQRMLSVALRSQRLEKPHAIDGLIHRSSIQLDASGESSAAALERPVGTVVESERPTFIWRPLKGASGYTVSVFNAQLNEVARSENLTTTAWTTPHMLQRGAIYRWQVIAVKDGREVVLPAPTEPEAKFKVLEQHRALELERARRRYANSHLALGLLYAQRGLLDEAETELQALVKDNPSSTVARKLLQSLQAWRNAQPLPTEDGEDVLRRE
jgi:Putative zinc-finger